MSPQLQRSQSRTAIDPSRRTEPNLAVTSNPDPSAALPSAAGGLRSTTTCSPGRSSPQPVVAEGARALTSSYDCIVTRNVAGAPANGSRRRCPRRIDQRAKALRLFGRARRGNLLRRRMLTHGPGRQSLASLSVRVGSRRLSAKRRSQRKYCRETPFQASQRTPSSAPAMTQFPVSGAHRYVDRERIQRANESMTIRS